MNRLPALIAALVLSTSALAACTEVSPAAPTTPPKLTVTVFQFRSDYGVRQLQIEVRNHGRDDVTVTSARFASAYFESAVSSKSAPSAVFAGSATDFPVVLPAARCESSTARARVTVGYRGPGGIRGTLTATPVDPFESLQTVHGHDCSQQAFEAVATITPPKALRIENVAGRPRAELDFTIMPTGAAGSATLDSIASTTLLSQPEGELRPFALTVTARSTPTAITLSFIPARCEQHLVAEDKIGTLIPFRVTVGPFHDALFTYPLSNELKVALYKYVALYCGW